MRFPEFRGEWKNYKVSELLSFYPTNSLAWEQLSYEKGQIRNLHYGLIHKGLSTIVDITKVQLPFIKDAFVPKTYTLCKNGDVAFADASEDTEEVAKVVELVECKGDTVVCGLHTIHGRDNDNITTIGFKGYAFSSYSFHSQIRRLAQGTKIYSINTTNFNEVSIGIPSKKEQIKISKFLFALDERIKAQSRIIEDLKKVKSAIIHQTIDMVGDKYPLSAFLEQVSERNHNNIPLEVLSVSNKFGFVSQSEQFEDREIASADKSNYKIVSKDVFAYNPARINVGSIARMKVNAQGIVSPMYICFKVKEGLLPQYLEYYFESTQFQKEIEKRLEGSVRLCLLFDGLCNIKVRIPQAKLQQKIVNRITSIGQKIDLETRILCAFQKERNALLRSMFI